MSTCRDLCQRTLRTGLTKNPDASLGENLAKQKKIRREFIIFSIWFGREHTSRRVKFKGQLVDKGGGRCAVEKVSDCRQRKPR